MDLRFLLFVGTTIAYIKCANGANCPDAWISFHESCYFFGDEIKLDWTEATHHCAALMSHLVTIESDAENRFIKDEANRYTNHATGSEAFWIGASDSEVEGLWVWYTDHSELSKTFTDWQKPHEPDEVGGQDCGCLWGDYHFTWGSCGCGAQLHIICEKTTDEGSEIIG